MLKERCPPDEYATCAADIGTAIDVVMTNTVDMAIHGQPALRSEIDDHIARHGRYR
ncbi:hypothetical protein D3C83_206660 [compost metagenome]